VGPAYFNCPFHMRQISVLDKKKRWFLYLFRYETVNGNGRWNSISPFISPGIKIESICFKLVESVLLIAYAILSILSPVCADHCFVFSDKKHFWSCRVMTRFAHYQNFLCVLVVCETKNIMGWCYKRIIFHICYLYYKIDLF
jgi:hypothetical protein